MSVRLPADVLAELRLVAASYGLTPRKLIRHFINAGLDYEARRRKSP